VKFQIRRAKRKNKSPGWRVRYVGDNNEIIASTQVYDRRRGAEQAILLLMMSNGSPTEWVK